MNFEKINFDLKENGHALFQVSPELKTTDLAQKFGEVVSSRKNGPIIDTLTPTPINDAHPHSLSAVYGTREFPFHTDGSNFKIPPRYILLRCVSQNLSERPTIIAPVSLRSFLTDELSSLKRDQWLVNGGRGKFYSPILTEYTDERGFIVRFDPVCMKAMNSSSTRSSAILQKYLDECPHHEIFWKKDVCALVDNWHTLHSRGGSSHSYDKTRVLERAYIL